LTERVGSKSVQGSGLTGAEFHYNGRFNTDSMAAPNQFVKHKLITLIYQTIVIH
jgi:hypothetical protein